MVRVTNTTTTPKTMTRTYWLNPETGTLVENGEDLNVHEITLGQNEAIPGVGHFKLVGRCEITVISDGAEGWVVETGLGTAFIPFRSLHLTTAGAK